MKKTTLFVVSFLMLTFFSVTVSAATTCGAAYMKDPCPVDGYSIMNIERFVRGRHNDMYDIHHFSDLRKTKHRKRAIYRKRVQHKKRYRYIKRCRTVKVRL